MTRHALACPPRPQPCRGTVHACVACLLSLCAGIPLASKQDRLSTVVSARCFAQLPGMYPNAAGKIVSNVPFKGKVGAPASPALQHGCPYGRPDLHARPVSHLPAKRLRALLLVAMRSPPLPKIFAGGHVLEVRLHRR